MIPVKDAVMVVLQRNGRFLLGKRSNWKKKAPGYWCPISGHVEAGETEEAAVVREAREELAVEVKPLKKLAATPTHDGTVCLHWWLADIVAGDPVLNNDENSELGWFTKPELAALGPVFKEDIAILLNI